ncbi:MAG: hypothetical protein MZW92_04425 [Comamonadaceae bacterium]|nr:hypothetical protein [Comamonadaceae bacterium]
MILVIGLQRRTRTRSRTWSRSMPGVLECAADRRARREGRARRCKLVVVKKDPARDRGRRAAPTARPHLTGYKRPKVVEFRPDLPKTPVGKILRRELRN